MTKEELEKLIGIERKLVGPSTDYKKLGYGYNGFKSESEEDCLKQFGLSLADHFLLESYAGGTYEYVDDQLRDIVHIPPDSFTDQYKYYLNHVLDNIDCLSSEECWRWDVREGAYDYLKGRIGAAITFPDFKSTSLKYKANTLRFRIKTSENSDGKQIYKHLHPEKAASEQEILFKSGSQFRIKSINDDHILLIELDDKIQTTDIVCSNFFWNPNIYSSRMLKHKFGTSDPSAII